MPVASKDYYKILGVSRESSDKDIKKSYRALAKACHPDINQGDEKLEAKFKEVSEGVSTRVLLSFVLFVW